MVSKSPFGIGRMGSRGSSFSAFGDEFSPPTMGSFHFLLRSIQSSSEKRLSRSMVSTLGSGLGSSELEGKEDPVVVQG